MTGPKRVTEKQLAANRANARRSTGPRTPQGKAISRYNALKHGILARAVIPEALEPYESRETFEQLLDAFRDAFAPANVLEELLIEQIAAAYWRLARLYRAEAGSIAHRQQRLAADRDRLELFRILSPPMPPAEAALQERIAALEEALTDPVHLRARMQDLDPSLAHASDADLRAAAEQRLDGLAQQLRDLQERQQAHTDAVDTAERSLPPLEVALRYSRYETALHNQLDRALARLERLQRRRERELVEPPIQVQVLRIDELELDQ